MAKKIVKETTDSTKSTQNISVDPPVSEAEPPALEIPNAITVASLAEMMKIGSIDLIKQLMRLGHMYTINDVLDYELAADVAESFGFDVYEPEEETHDATSIVPSTDVDDLKDLVDRPPVITILGHVDHGKTTILDAIRKTKVVDAEAGGITQHIGAYQVKHNEKLITFLDTPGHEAFTSMRVRGAQVTDIAVLVVAADDGLMPQTQEAIDHIIAAGVPMLVCINKMDKPEADPEKIKRQLSERDLLVEDWGGDIISVPVSATKKDGIPDLLENLQLLAEMAELKGNPQKLASGVVVEARLDKRRGPVATALIQTGTLHVGDHITIRNLRGRVKAMLNDQGYKVDHAGPSTPVEILGISGLPEAGDIFNVAPDEKTAKQMVIEHEQQASHQTTTLEDAYTRIESGMTKYMNLIIKTDVQGSVDAVLNMLNSLSDEQSKIKIIRASAGGITENDVMLASASDAIIIGFNSELQPGASALAAQEGIDIRTYKVIYDLTDDIAKALHGLLEPVFKDVIEGEAAVRETFEIGRKGTIAGFYVNKGKITRESTIHIIRNGEHIHEGSIISLKHFKNDVKEVSNGNEGGILVNGFNEFEEGDVLEAHRSEQVSKN
jgi:translation initiation factor IF-2|tara:strand:- start:8972 stop:10798 length:1827 start_codon:yes stop_codon:yes gene_type:complete